MGRDMGWHVHKRITTTKTTCSTARNIVIRCSNAFILTVVCSDWKGMREKKLGISNLINIWLGLFGTIRRTYHIEKGFVWYSNVTAYASYALHTHSTRWTDWNLYRTTENASSSSFLYIKNSNVHRFILQRSSLCLLRHSRHCPLLFPLFGFSYVRRFASKKKDST